MKRLRLILLAVAALLLASASSASSYSSGLMSITVYTDGYAIVTQSLTVDPKAASVQVPLISPVVSNLVATDQNGSPLSYGFSAVGGNITVYTLGSSEATLRYDTDNLTSKQGTVWTVAFTSRFNLTLILPPFSTLEWVSGAPTSINQTGSSPELVLPPGEWKVSYGVPLGVTSASGSGGTTAGGGGSVAGLSDVELGAAGAAVVGAAVLVLALRWWRRGGVGSVSRDLRPDDLQVLNFIQEKGGKVLEPEIRMRFALPKTSAWRQIKRLERLGYVRVTKIGSQNQIELVRERSPGA